MKWHRLYKEDTEEVNLKKLLKQNGVTKLPSGTKFKTYEIYWSKEGGYAGEKTLSRIRAQIRDGGWKKIINRKDASPDDSWDADTNIYISPDGNVIMSYYSYYGATAADNSFFFTFKLAEN